MSSPRVGPVEILTRAGIKAGDMEVAMTGVIRLATNGVMSLDHAAKVAAQAVDAFNLTGKDLPDLADLLTA